MLLAVDIGNTRSKFAVFKGDTLLRLYVSGEEQHRATVEKIFSEYPDIVHVVASSVSIDPQQIPFPEQVSLHVVDGNWKFPYVNRYETPETLGIDRMILAAGATLKFPDQPRVVIDAGTCVTFDVVDAGNQYLGGAISPGVRMRYRAMHEFTAKLPQLDPAFPESAIGKSTASSMHCGASLGAVYEIEGFLSQCAETHPNFITILTGGDADFLATRLKNTIFAHSNFLLESLNALYQYNQE